jgi:hypothetical protein
MELVEVKLRGMRSLSRFNPSWSLFRPDKTNAVTVVEPDGMLPVTVTVQGLQVVTGWHSQIL